MRPPFLGQGHERLRAFALVRVESAARLRSARLLIARLVLSNALRDLQVSSEGGLECPTRWTSVGLVGSARRPCIDFICEARLLMI